MMGRMWASPRWQLVRALHRLAPRLTVLVAFLTVAEGVLPSARSIASGALVAAVAAWPAAEALGTALVALGLVQVTQFALPRWRATGADALARRFLRATTERQMRAALRP